MGSHSKNTRKPSKFACASNASLPRQRHTIKNCLIDCDIKLIDESIYASYADIVGALGVDFFIESHISPFLFNTKNSGIPCN